MSLAIRTDTLITPAEKTLNIFLYIFPQRCVRSLWKEKAVGYAKEGLFEPHVPRRYTLWQPFVFDLFPYGVPRPQPAARPADAADRAAGGTAKKQKKNALARIAGSVPDWTGRQAHRCFFRMRRRSAGCTASMNA
jgi:hypothetical protein